MLPRLHCFFNAYFHYIISLILYNLGNNSTAPATIPILLIIIIIKLWRVAKHTTCEFCRSYIDMTLLKLFSLVIRIYRVRTQTKGLGACPCMLWDLVIIAAPSFGVVAVHMCGTGTVDWRYQSRPGLSGILTHRHAHRWLGSSDCQTGKSGLSHVLEHLQMDHSPRNT